MIKVSIIIIEYHCMDQVQTCLASVEKYLSDIAHECVVLSNSCYGSAELQSYQCAIGSARLVAALRNLGYAGGVNAALTEVHGEYVYILNPDCILTDSNALEIIQCMDADRELAIVGPKVVDEHGNVQPSCRRFPKPWTFLLVRSFMSRLAGAALEQKRYLMKDYSRIVPRCVDWVSGGAVIAKVSAIARMGGMDERFFLYMEDVDWCRTAWENGFKVIYHPGSTVVHAGQHRSINVGLMALTNRHLRWHLASMYSYFMKYRWRAAPKTAYYLESGKEPECSARKKVSSAS